MRYQDTHFSKCFIDMISFRSLITILRDGGVCFSISLVRKLRHRKIQQLAKGKLGTQLCLPVTEPGSFA